MIANRFAGRLVGHQKWKDEQHASNYLNSRGWVMREDKTWKMPRHEKLPTNNEHSALKYLMKHFNHGNWKY